jgi:hypothetical protein
MPLSIAFPRFYSVKCLVRRIVGRIGKLGRDVVKTLIISDNQTFHGLIIRPFDNQTVSLPWLSRISDISENQPQRLDSDNQINISRLISYLVSMRDCEWGWLGKQVRRALYHQYEHSVWGNSYDTVSSENHSVSLILSDFHKVISSFKTTLSTVDQNSPFIVSILYIQCVIKTP